MSQTLRKRGREPENLLDSLDIWESKRFKGEETDQFSHLTLLTETLAEEAECATYSSFLAAITGDNLAASDISGGHECQTLVSESGIDLCYLLEASDDELGIPPSSVLDVKDEVCQSGKEISLTSEGFWENPDLNCLGENKLFQNNFENNLEFQLFDDANCDASRLQDFTNRDFVSQEILFGGDFSAAWILETAWCI